MTALLGTVRGKPSFHADDDRVTVRSGVLVCNQCGHEHGAGRELRFYFHPQRTQEPWVCTGECYDKQVEDATQYLLAAESLRRLGGNVEDGHDDRSVIYACVFAGGRS